MTDLQDELQNGPLHLVSELVLNGWTVSRAMPIDENTTTIRFDLGQLAPEIIDTRIDWTDSPENRGRTRAALLFDKNSFDRYRRRFLFDGSESEPQVISPTIVTTVYRVDPDTLPKGDTLAATSNLVCYEHTSQRFVVDRQYLADYRKEWNKVEVNHALSRPIRFITGCLLVFGGAVAIATTSGLGTVGGYGSILVGLDYATSAWTGRSFTSEWVLEPIIRFAFAVTGRNATFVDEPDFDAYHFTGSPFTNIMLTQITYMALGGILQRGVSGLNSLRQYLQSRAPVCPIFKTAVDFLRKPQFKAVWLKVRSEAASFSIWTRDGTLHLGIGTINRAVLQWLSTILRDDFIVSEATVRLLYTAEVVLATYLNIKRGARNIDAQLTSLRGYLRTKHWKRWTDLAVNTGLPGKIALGVKMINWCARITVVLGAVSL